jgi:hypothetical protein
MLAHHVTRLSNFASIMMRRSLLQYAAVLLVLIACTVLGEIYTYNALPLEVRVDL